MPNPHDVALFTLTAGTAVAALLMADAADEARDKLIQEGQRPRMKLSRARRMAVWARPMAMRGVSLGFLCGMATSGAFLVGAFPPP